MIVVVCSGGERMPGGMYVRMSTLWLFSSLHMLVKIIVFCNAMFVGLGLLSGLQFCCEMCGVLLRRALPGPLLTQVAHGYT